MPDFISDLFSNVVIAIIVFNSLLWIAYYIFNSIALYAIAKRRGLPSPIRAWVPFASTFLFGKIAEQFEAAKYNKSKPYSKILLGLEIPRTVLMFLNYVFFFSTGGLNFDLSQIISLLGNYNYLIFNQIFSIVYTAVNIAFIVFYYVALYKVYSSLVSNTTMYIVLSILFGISPFFLFALRNKDEGYDELNRKQNAQYYARPYYYQNSLQYSYPNIFEPPFNNTAYNTSHVQKPTNSAYNQQHNDDLQNGNKGKDH